MTFKADPLAVHAVVHGDVRVSAGPLSSSSSGHMFKQGRTVGPLVRPRSGPRVRRPVLG